MDGQPAVREVMLLSGADVERGWVRVPLAGTDGAIQFSDLARFQPKMLFGDPSKDDNDLLSSWQWSDLSGGVGVTRSKEGTDQGKYADGTLYTRFPNQIIPPLGVNNNQLHQANGALDFMVLGEIWDVATLTTYVVYTRGDLEVRRGRVTPVSDGTFDTSYATPSSGFITNPADAKGTAFQGTGASQLFFIPQGNNGYATITGTSVAPTEYAAPKFRNFTVWDNKLIGVTTGGRLYYTVDGTTWVAYDLTYQMSNAYKIREIINFFDRRDEPCCYILTGRDIWQFDPDGPELFRIDFGWPSHPYHAQASCVWQGQLFIAVGMGVFRYSGGTWMAVGLDAGDGLSVERQGYITDLVAGYNAMYAVVQAVDYGSVYGAISGIYEFTGSGWHCIWDQHTLGGVSAQPSNDQYHAPLAATPFVMTGAIVTRSGGDYTLIWSTADPDQNMYSMRLPITWANPRKAVELGFLNGNAAYYYLESSEFDADMEGYTKIAASFQFTVDMVTDPVGPDASRKSIHLLAKIDGGPWERVGGSVVAKPGRYSVQFGDALDTDEGGTSLYSGVPFERIQFRVELWDPGSGGADGDNPPIITNLVFAFLKTVSSNDSFTLTVNCSNGSTDGQLSPQELTEWIDELTSSDHFGLMRFGPYTYRVFTAQNGGTRYGSDSQQGMRSISIVEIPSTL